MKLLALETASRWCSVALLEEGQVPRELCREAPREQTQLLLPMVDALLQEAGWTLAGVDAIAFGHGPGAFTGVRVATSVAQGLAFSSGRPLIGVSTLASCALAAAQAHGAGAWLAAFDARMGEIYLGGYQVDAQGTVKTLLADCLCAPDQIPALPSASWQGAGDGGLLDQVAAACGVSHWHADVAPRAGTVAQLAMSKLRAGETLSPEQAAPVYLRNRVIQGAIK